MSTKGSTKVALKEGVPKRMVVEILYVEIRSHMKTTAGTSEELSNVVGVHQGSVLNPLLLIIIMDKATSGARKGIP